MQMTPEQLVEEYRDTVLELHLIRRHVAAMKAENTALRAQLVPEPTEPASSPEG